MNVSLLYDDKALRLRLPESTMVYSASFPKPLSAPSTALISALNTPFGGSSLRNALQKRRPGSVCIVVSDVTRPIPYSRFLPALVREITDAGVPKKALFLLIATGMHRPSTAAERRAMFGAAIASGLRIVDHRAEEASETRAVAGRSASGARVKLNRHYLDADFRIVTGLVEPHFMAGFSGGRKAICPGLASLETVRNFHGARFLSSSAAVNANLKGNPLHQEAESIARLAGCEFCVNVVLDRNKRPVRFFAGDIFKSHAAAVAFVRKHACPEVKAEADIVITGSGGYPLDATFYQCVKGFVSCLPAVRRGGVVLALGGCREAAGGPEYAGVLKKYSGKWERFLSDIRKPGSFIKDQWQFQMHTRALKRVGPENLFFLTEGISEKGLAGMSVNGRSIFGERAALAVQRLFDSLYRKGMRVAVFPEGPYCAPCAKSPAI